MSEFKLADGSLSSEHKIGDKFTVTHSTVFAKGSVVQLYRDNESSCPLFKLVHGDCRFRNCCGEKGGFTGWEGLGKALFTKSDLKDGMRLTHERGDETLFFNGELLVIKSDKFAEYSLHADMSYYDNDLNVIGLSSFAIIRVTDRDGTVLFEREAEPKKMTVADIERELGYPVEVVK